MEPSLPNRLSAGQGGDRGRGTARRLDPETPSPGKRLTMPTTPITRSRTRPGRPGGRSFALAAVCGVAIVACKPPVGDPLGLAPRIAPFERLPYVQAVGATGGRVVWLARAEAADSAELRIAGEDVWHAVSVVRDTARIMGLSGPVVRRHIEVDGLLPSTTVEYRVLADSAIQAAGAFRTAPPSGTADTVRLLAFGDSGWGSDPPVRLAELMERDRWDLAVHTGDIAYQRGSEADFTIRHFHVYRNVLARAPFFPSPGNHDLRAAGGAAYARAFFVPTPEPDARYYTFRWGDIQFIALDTTDEDAPGEFFPPEPDDPPPLGALAAPAAADEPTDGAELRRRRGRQYEWLEATLAEAAADPTVRWTIAYMHYPPYSNASGLVGHGSDNSLRQAITPLFDRYGVDLVLTGHDHHYERSWPIRDGHVVRRGCGPVYVVTGGGGASRYARSISDSPLSERSSRRHHFVKILVHREAIDVEAIDVEARSFDAFRVLPYLGTDARERALEPRCHD